MNIEYFIDREKGIITAKLEKSEVEKELLKLARYWSRPVLFEWEDSLYNSKMIKALSAITARATCSEEDTFDENIGKRIARERLLNKLDKKKLSFINERKDDCINAYAKMSQAYYKIEEYIADHENNI